MHSERFGEAMRRIEAACGDDPQRLVVDGVEQPAGLVYSRRMTAWLDRIEPGASEELRIAAAAQHIRRWDLPRGSFPMDREGYLQWRTMLGRHHANVTGEIMRACGYDERTVERVGDLLMKKRLKADAEAQRLEDVSCLVFLEYELAGFLAQHADYSEEKLLRILSRTWKKMSDVGRSWAMNLLPGMEPGARELLVKASSL
jgi:hypothetical protein